MNSGDMVPNNMRMRALKVVIVILRKYDGSKIGCWVPFFCFFATLFIVMCVACSVDSFWLFILYFSLVVSFSNVNGEIPWFMESTNDGWLDLKIARSLTISCHSVNWILESCFCASSRYWYRTWYQVAFVLSEVKSCQKGVSLSPSISPDRTCIFIFVCSVILIEHSGIASSSIVGWFCVGRFPSLRDVVMAVDIICAKRVLSIWTILFSILFGCAWYGSGM